MSPSGNVPPSAGKARSGPYLPGTRSLRVGEASVSSPTHPNTVAAAGRVTPSQKREMMWRNALARLPARRCYRVRAGERKEVAPPGEGVQRKARPKAGGPPTLREQRLWSGHLAKKRWQGIRRPWLDGAALDLGADQSRTLSQRVQITALDRSSRRKGLAFRPESSWPSSGTVTKRNLPEWR